MKAFPNPHRTDELGMALRDYFAGQALQGAIAHGLFNSEKAEKGYPEYLAFLAYAYADAMLEARRIDA
jgi:hypothetical protein